MLASRQYNLLSWRRPFDKLHHNISAKIVLRRFQPRKVFQKKNKQTISIGNDVWIGSDVTIMAGVKIADGAVVGAKSVIACDIPPYAIYAGNPARLIRYRFSEETIKKLLEIRWWHWDKEKIKAHLTDLKSEPTDESLERLILTSKKPGSKNPEIKDGISKVSK